MAQSDVGSSVVESISRPYRKVYERFTKTFGDPSKMRDSRSPSNDPWHREMVEKANRSFQKSEAKKRTPAKRAKKRR